MQKKLRKSIFFVLLCAVFSFVFCLNLSYKNVKASTASPDVTKSTYADYDFDETLFQAVFAMARQLNCNQMPIGRGFDLNLFLQNTDPTYYPTYVTTGEGTDGYAENVDARNEIVADLKNGILDLTTGSQARYACLKNVSPIKSISGLNSLSLSFIKKLYLNNNNITEVKSTDFEGLTGLQEIYLGNNKLTNFQLNPTVLNVSVLNLSDNNLKQIDLSLLKDNAKVDLSNNQIESVSNITLLQGAKKFDTLNLDFNLLTNLSEEDVQTLSNKTLNVLNLGVQGLSTTNEITAGDTIKVYNQIDNYLPNISLAFYYFEGNSNISKSDLYIDGEENLICYSSLSQEDVYLPAGKIKIKFLSNGSFANEELYPNYSPKVLQVKLPSPKYTIFVNGKESKNTYQEENFDVQFYFEENENIPNLEDVLQNAKIFSTLNNNQASEGHTVNIYTNGTFKCSGYISFDNINSDRTTVSVSRKYVKGIIIGIISIIIIFVVIAAGYFISMWYRNGAMVAPLSEKERASLNRKKAKQQDEVRETFVRGMGKERYFKTQENDEVLKDLNSNREVGSYYNSSEKSDYDENNYSDRYNSVGNNFERYSTEETKNDFDDETSKNNENDVLDDENNVNNDNFNGTDDNIEG